MNDQLLKTLQTSRAYTLRVAEAMPDNLMTVKPAGAGWNYLELLHHIAYGIEWWAANYIRDEQTPWEPGSPHSKAGVLDTLANNYDNVQQLIDRPLLTDRAIHGFYATMDHITHHRGQAVLYLRMNGIEPPEYTY